MVHSITLLLILVVLMPYASFIPMPAIAAILFVVAYNMSEWRVFVELVKTAPKSDIIVLVATFVLTIVFDLVVAIEIGIVLTALLFMKRMSDVTQINGWKYIDDEEEENENDPERIQLRKVPKNTLVYEVVGPMFFAAAYKFIQIPTEKSVNAIILRMKGVPAMDATALKTLQEIHHKCKKNHITLIFSHIQEQPLSVIKKAGFDKIIQEENICSNIDLALKRASSLSKAKG